MSNKNWASSLFDVIFRGSKRQWEGGVWLVVMWAWVSGIYVPKQTNHTHTIFLCSISITTLLFTLVTWQKSWEIWKSLYWGPCHVLVNLKMKVSKVILHFLPQQPAKLLELLLIEPKQAVAEAQRTKQFFLWIAWASLTRKQAFRFTHQGKDKSHRTSPPCFLAFQQGDWFFHTL